MLNSYNAQMSTLAERLKKAMEENQSLTKTGLWKACGLSSGAVSHWFGGGTKELKGDNLLKAASYLGVSVDWLSSGLGSMYNKKSELRQERSEYQVKEPTVVAGIKIKSNEAILLEHYRKLSNQSQQTIDLLLNRLYELEHPNDLQANPTNGKAKKKERETQ